MINNRLINTISIDYNRAFIVALPIILIFLLFSKLSWILLLIPFLILFAIIYGEKFLVFAAIVSILVLRSTISVELRLVVQVLLFLILIYLFFNKYGLNFAAYPKIPKDVLILLLLLYLSMIVSTIFSNYILLGCKEIGRLSIFLIIAYLFFGLLRSEKDLRIYLAALFCTGLVYILNVTYGFIQNGFNIFIPNLEELVKPKGDYLNLNSIGSFFIIIISLLLALFLSDKNKKRRSYLLIFISIYVFALIITNSRAAILSTVISSLFIIYFKNKKIFIRIISVILILIPVLLLSPLNNYIDLYFRVERLTSGRNWIWETVFNVIKDHPILGVGPAATKYEMYKELPFMLGSHAEKFILFHYHEIEFGHAHNFYLFFLSDLGILGLATSLFLPFVFIKMGFQNMKKFKDKFPENYWLSLGITAAGIGLFIRGIFEWGNLISYGTLGIDLPFWLIFMILIFLYQKKITVTRNVSKI